MSYVSQTDARSRITAIAGVATVHVAMGFAVLVGLAASGVIETKDGPLTAITFRDPPPPPAPTPTETATIIVPPMAAPKPPVDLSSDNSVDVVEFDPQVPVVDLPAIVPPNTGLPLVQPPKPTPRPSFTLVAAKPLGNAGAWITTADYPAGPLRRGIEGVTSYRLVIGSNGRVNACEITASSGNSQLDAATCSNLTRRARFEPATDGNGTKTAGSFNGTVRWQIPE